MTIPILQFKHVSKSFFGIPALQGVSLNLEAGTALGLIGENGAGKSTLMNILGGVIQPDCGKISLHGKPYPPVNPSLAKQNGIAFIHQELNLFSNLSILDNLLIDGFPTLGKTPLINRNKAKKMAQAFLQAVNLDIPPNTLIEHLTPGERQLVEIARALSQDAQIIIFDEPTTSLTAHESQRLFALIHGLKQEGRSIFYISHNLGDVLNLADTIAILRDGCLVETGSVNTYTTESMIAKMVGRDLSRLYPERSASSSSQAVLDVQNISQEGIANDISLTLHQGEILGLFGLMGSGRSELARILFGIDPRQRGEIILRGKTRQAVSPRNSISQGLAFVTENRHEEGLLMEANVYDNMALASIESYAKMGQFIQPKQHGASIVSMAKSLQIKAGRLKTQSVKSLSGGNQQKVVIGKWLLARPAVLILDEPTRGIDVGAKYEIYCIINELAAQGTGILCISSELEELMGICDRIMVMSNGEVQGSFERDLFDQTTILQTAFKGHKIHQANAEERLHP